MLSIRMFGETEVQAGAGTLGLRDFGSVKSRQILELLVLHRGRSISKDELADLLWAGAPPADCISTVESYVSVLRSRLQPGRGREGSVVRTGRNSYALNPEQVRVDLDEFDLLVDDHLPYDRTRGSVAPSAHHLRAALKIARGTVLAHEPYAAWATATRERYRARVVETLTALARECLRSGEIEEAATLAESAVHMDPLSESACRLVMRAQWLAGRRVGALRSYECLRATLRDELGIDPGRQTQALFVSILRSDMIEEPDDGSDELRTLVGAVIELYHRGPAARPSATATGTVACLPTQRGPHAADPSARLLIDLIARTSTQQDLLPAVC